MIIMTSENTCFVHIHMENCIVQIYGWEEIYCVVLVFILPANHFPKPVIGFGIRYEWCLFTVDLYVFDCLFNRNFTSINNILYYCLLGGGKPVRDYVHVYFFFLLIYCCNIFLVSTTLHSNPVLSQVIKRTVLLSRRKAWRGPCTRPSGCTPTSCRTFLR